jgi:hypothetical protein
LVYVGGTKTHVALADAQSILRESSVGSLMREGYPAMAAELRRLVDQASSGYSVPEAIVVGAHGCDGRADMATRSRALRAAVRSSHSLART